MRRFLFHALAMLRPGKYRVLAVDMLTFTDPSRPDDQRCRAVVRASKGLTIANRVEMLRQAANELELHEEMK